MFFPCGDISSLSIPCLIEQWITEMFPHIEVEDSPDGVGKLAQDGILVAKILERYGVVQKAVMDKMKKSDSPDQCFINYGEIMDSLKMVCPRYNEDLIKSLTNGNFGTGLQLLLDLYMCLSDKGLLHYRVRQNEPLAFEKPFTLGIDKNDPEWNLTKLQNKLMKKKESATSFPLLVPPMEQTKWFKEEAAKIINCLTSYREKYPNMADFSSEENFVNQSGEPRRESKKPRNYAYSERTKKDLRSAFLQQRINSFASSLYERHLKKYDQEYVLKCVKKLSLPELGLQNFLKGDEQFWKFREIEKEYKNRVMTEPDFSLPDDNEDVRYLEQKKRVEARMEREAFRMRRRYCDRIIASICKDVLLDILDISVLIVDHRVRKEIITKRTWLHWLELFFSEAIMIPKTHDPLESIFSNEMDDKGQPIKYLEERRQEAFDVIDLSDYLRGTGKWKMGITEASFYQISELPQNIYFLTNVVKSVLEMKYPPQKFKTPAEIQKFPISAIVLGVREPKALHALCEMLQQNNVLPVLPSKVVSSCLNEYVETIKNHCEQEKNLEICIEEHLKEVEKSAFYSGRFKDKAQQYLMEQISSELVTVKKSYFQMIPSEPFLHDSTPKIEANDDPLSRKLLYGKLAYDMLCLGSTVDDSLIVGMIVEYIKDFVTEDGWVLLNFPETPDQAIVLEEALTGKKVPRNYFSLHDDIRRFFFLRGDLPLGKIIGTDGTCIQKQTVGVTIPESNDEKRFSCLFHKTNIKKLDSWTTYFTKYIHVITGEEKDEYANQSFKRDYSHLDRLYAAQDVCHRLSFPYLCDENLRSITNLAIQKREMNDGEATENELTCEQSIVTTGDRVIEDFLDFLNAKTKPISLTSAASNIDITGNISLFKVPVFKRIDLSEILEDLEEAPKDFLEYNSYISESKISSIMSKILPDFWEALEKDYLKKIKLMLFGERLHKLIYTPYLRSIEKRFNVFVSRPDKLQIILNQFQKVFREFDEDERKDPDIIKYLFKNLMETTKELHCLANERHLQNEKFCYRLLEDIPETLCRLANVYLIGLEAEIQRCLRTLQLLDDYYRAILRRPPLSKSMFPTFNVKHMTTLMEYADLEKHPSDMPLFEIINRVETEDGSGSEAATSRTSKPRPSMKKKERKSEIQSENKDQAEIKDHLGYKRNSENKYHPENKEQSFSEKTTPYELSERKCSFERLVDIHMKEDNTKGPRLHVYIQDALFASWKDEHGKVVHPVLVMNSERFRSSMKSIRDAYNIAKASVAKVEEIMMKKENLRKVREEKRKAKEEKGDPDILPSGDEFSLSSDSPLSDSESELDENIEKEVEEEDLATYPKGYKYPETEETQEDAENLENVSQREEIKNRMREERKKAEGEWRTLSLEWKSAMKEEVERALHRIISLQEIGIKDLTEIHALVWNSFSSFHERSKKRLDNERGWINQALKYLLGVIRKRSEKCHYVAFKKDRCIAEQNTLIAKEENLLKEKSVGLIMDCRRFCVCQLENLRLLLEELYPRGIVELNQFTTILWNAKKMQRCFLECYSIPQLWHHLAWEDLREMMREVFGKTGWIYWKNFIIQSLELPFPTAREIVHTMNQFKYFDATNKGTISFKDFSKITFWFESVNETSERKSIACHYKIMKMLKELEITRSKDLEMKKNRLLRIQRLAKIKHPIPEKTESTNQSAEAPSVFWLIENAGTSAPMKKFQALVVRILADKKSGSSSTDNRMKNRKSSDTLLMNETKTASQESNGFEKFESVSTLLQYPYRMILALIKNRKKKKKEWVKKWIRSKNKRKCATWTLNGIKREVILSEKSDIYEWAIHNYGVFFGDDNYWLYNEEGVDFPIDQAFEILMRKPERYKILRSKRKTIPLLRCFDWSKKWTNTIIMNMPKELKVRRTTTSFVQNKEDPSNPDVFLWWKPKSRLSLELLERRKSRILSRQRTRESFEEFSPIKSMLNVKEDEKCKETTEALDRQPSYARLRIALAKQLLFRTFRVKNGEMDYRELLFSFCKDKNPKEGLRKALSLYTGKIIADKKCIKEENIRPLMIEKRVQSEQYAENRLPVSTNRRLSLQHDEGNTREEKNILVSKNNRGVLFPPSCPHPKEKKIGEQRVEIQDVKKTTEQENVKCSTRKLSYVTETIEIASTRNRREFSRSHMRSESFPEQKRSVLKDDNKVLHRSRGPQSQNQKKYILERKPAETSIRTVSLRSKKKLTFKGRQKRKVLSSILMRKSYSTGNLTQLRKEAHYSKWHHIITNREADVFSSSKQQTTQSSKFFKYLSKSEIEVGQLSNHNKIRKTASTDTEKVGKLPSSQNIKSIGTKKIIKENSMPYYELNSESSVMDNAIPLKRKSSIISINTALNDEDYRVTSKRSMNPLEERIAKYKKDLNLSDEHTNLVRKAAKTRINIDNTLPLDAAKNSVTVTSLRRRSNVKMENKASIPLHRTAALTSIGLDSNPMENHLVSSSSESFFSLSDDSSTLASSESYIKLEKKPSTASFKRPSSTQTSAKKFKEIPPTRKPAQTALETIPPEYQPKRSSREINRNYSLRSSVIIFVTSDDKPEHKYRRRFTSDTILTKPKEKLTRKIPEKVPTHNTREIRLHRKPGRLRIQEKETFPERATIPLKGVPAQMSLNVQDPSIVDLTANLKQESTKSLKRGINYDAQKHIPRLHKTKTMPVVKKTLSGIVMRSDTTLNSDFRSSLTISSRDQLSEGAKKSRELSEQSESYDTTSLNISTPWKIFTPRPKDISKEDIWGHALPNKIKAKIVISSKESDSHMKYIRVKILREPGTVRSEEILLKSSNHQENIWYGKLKRCEKCALSRVEEFPKKIYLKRNEKDFAAKASDSNMEKPVEEELNQNFKTNESVYSDVLLNMNENRISSQGKLRSRSNETQSANPSNVISPETLKIVVISKSSENGQKLMEPCRLCSIERTLKIPKYFILQLIRDSLKTLTPEVGEFKNDLTVYSKKIDKILKNPNKFLDYVKQKVDFQSINLFQIVNTLLKMNMFNFFELSQSVTKNAIMRKRIQFAYAMAPDKLMTPSKSIRNLE